jgi:hypothetical protein
MDHLQVVLLRYHKAAYHCGYCAQKTLKFRDHEEFGNLGNRSERVAHSMCRLCWIIFFCSSS